VSYGSLEEAILYGYEFERQYVCHAHNDHNASASVNAVSGWFFCYACGHRGRIDPETDLIDFHRMTSDTLILVEGMSDVAAVYEAGFHCAIGCYRNGLSAAQVKLLLKYDPRKVLVGFDQDSGGEIGWQRVRKVLGGQVSLHRMWWKGYKDLAAIPLEERREMLTEMLDNESVTMVDTVSTLDRLGA
jgi:DNA primase